MKLGDISMQYRSIRIGFLISTVWVLFSCCSNENHIEKIGFNEQQWRNGNDLIRGSMVDNIIGDSILIGKEKAEVLSLLGEPTGGDTSNSLVYSVDIGLKTGPFGLGGVWPFFMTIEFDSTGMRVEKVRCTD